MVSSKVYFYENLFDIRGGVDSFLSLIAQDYGKTNNPVGVKIHFGDKENVTHIKPEWIIGLKDHFANPVFIECNVLYRSPRTKRDTHLKLAKEHGFDFLPIDILDGEIGQDVLEVEVNTKNTKFAKLGKGLSKYKKCIALSHFKGHMEAGFGGALKNIGMGLGSRAGKLAMHSSVSPIFKSEACIGCSKCAEDCPVNAITVAPKARVDKNKCIGCAHCIAVCPQGAIRIPWKSDPAERVMEKIADYAMGAMKGREWRFINFLTNITMHCDCVSGRQEPITPDIGILYSHDPVAIDQASFDLFRKANGGRDPFKEHHRIDGEHILPYAEKLGIGTTKYELVRFGPNKK